MTRRQANAAGSSNGENIQNLLQMLLEVQQTQVTMEAHGEEAQACRGEAQACHDTKQARREEAQAICEERRDRKHA